MSVAISGSSACISECEIVLMTAEWAAADGMPGPHSGRASTVMVVNTIVMSADTGAMPGLMGD